MGENGYSVFFMHPSMLSQRVGWEWGASRRVSDSNHLPVVETFDHFSGLERQLYLKKSKKPDPCPQFTLIGALCRHKKLSVCFGSMRHVEQMQDKSAYQRKFCAKFIVRCAKHM